MFDYTDLVNEVKGVDFEEIPVQIEEFVTSSDYLNMGKTPLSDYQYELIRMSSQIYKEETLIALYGEEEGIKRFKTETKNEIIAQLGKGSGKDFVSTIACAYVVYLLLCLKDPAEYYGKTTGDTIDIINVAVNAEQAKNVFFRNFKERIQRSPWFEGRYSPKMNSIEFDKNVTVYSGNSERESFEGYNLFMAVLDEISAFAMDSASGNANAKTAHATYKMYSQSVVSRFAKYGKIVLLSFPRYKTDFISTRYAEVVADKEVVLRSHLFKLDPDLPDGVESNEFTIEWEEDHIVSYKYPKVWALKRPSWEVNPTKTIDEYMISFFQDPTDTLGRFACMPPDAEDGFFTNPDKLKKALSGTNMVVPESGGIFLPGYEPDYDSKYYIHVDLAQKVDRAAVAIARVDRWVSRNIGGVMTDPEPHIIVDVIMYWTPTRKESIDLSDVRDWIVSLPSKGFNIGVVTFDRWNSVDMIKYLNAMGIKAEVLSVGNKEFMNLSGVIAAERLQAPKIDILQKEIIQLRTDNKGKIDHPRGGSKDLADALAGAVHNAGKYSQKTDGDEIQVYTPKDILRNVSTEAPGVDRNKPGVIYPPSSTPPPDDLSEYLRGLKLL